MKNNNVIFSTRSALYALFFSPYYFFHHQPSAKKKKWKICKFRRGGTEKGVGMGREGKGLLLSFFYHEIALTLSSPLLCLPLTQAKELDMSCDTIVQHFLKLFLHSILIRDCSKHIDKTYLQQSKALKVHCVNKFVHGLVWKWSPREGYFSNKPGAL